MIKGLLRGLVGVITMPIIFGVYWVISAGLIALGAEPAGEFTNTLWAIGLAWVFFLMIYPSVNRQLSKVVA